MASVANELRDTDTRLGNALVSENYQRAGPLCNAISITGSVLRGALTTLGNILTQTGLQEEWNGPPPANGVMNMQALEFYRLWRWVKEQAVA